MQYNTLGHPSFDSSLPRVAVLVTTGRLKGAAPVDADQYKKSAASRKLADVEIWERPDLIDWICSDPGVGIAGSQVSLELMTMVTNILNGTVNEPSLERHTRRWTLPATDQSRSAVEAAIYINALVSGRRLDLALSAALHLFRSTQVHEDSLEGLEGAALRLVLHLCSVISTQSLKFLESPEDLVLQTLPKMGLVTYPVMCSRIMEAGGLGLAIAMRTEDREAIELFKKVLSEIARQPGAARPPADLFATSMLVGIIMLSTYDLAAANKLLREVSTWLLDRHDSEVGGLGLASLSENEETTATRLLGGWLEGTELSLRKSSYVATVVLDLALFLDNNELYGALLSNFGALQIVPESTKANESIAKWHRGGANVWPQPRIDFDEWGRQIQRPLDSSGTDEISSLLLTASCRSRHYPGGWKGLLNWSDGQRWGGPQDTGSLGTGSA